MMGLLGESWDDPKSMATLQLAAGLLSPGSFGEGLGRGLQGYQTTMDSDQRNKFMKQQMAMLESKTAMENAALLRQQKLQDFLAQKFGGQTPAAQQFDAGQQALGAGASAGDMGPTIGNATRQTAIQAQQPQSPSGFPLSFNDVTMLKVMGGPDLTEQFKVANEGFEQKAGSYYKDPASGQLRYMPKLDNGMNLVNGQAQAVPGYSAANADIKGAETRAQEGAKAGFDFVSIPMADGSSRMVRRDQAASFLGSNAIPGLGVAQSPNDQTYGNETAKTAAEQYKTIQSSGLTAPGKIAKYQELGRLLDGYEGGALTGAGMELSRFANSLGIKVDDKLGNKEAAKALTNELALSLRSTANGEGMPGAMSDADRQFLLSSVPNLAQSAAGRKQMVQMQVAVLQRSVDVAKMARQWQHRYGRLDAVNPATGRGFFDNLQDWSERNPLFNKGQ